MVLWAAINVQMSPKPLWAMAHVSLRVCALKQGPHSPLHGFLTNQPTNPGEPTLLAARLGAERCPHISWTSNSPVSPLSLFLPPSPFVAHGEGLGHPGHSCCPGSSSEAGQRYREASASWLGLGTTSPCPPSSPAAFLYRSNPGNWVLRRQLICEKKPCWFKVCSSNSVFLVQLHENTLHF